MTRLGIDPATAVSLDFAKLAAVFDQATASPRISKKVLQKKADLRAWALTLAAHLLLAAFLILGVRWQSTSPAVIEAELWAPAVRQAAPSLPIATATPEPVQEKEKEKLEAAPSSAPPPKANQADIALEKQARKLEAQKAAQRELAKQEKIKLAKEQAAEQEKREQALKEKAQKTEKEQLAKAKAEASKRFEQDRQRLIASAGTGSPSSTSTDLNTASPRGTAQWQGYVRACVQPNVNFPVDSIMGNPASDFAIERLPDGSIASVKVVRSGGNAGFDAAVVRAINACGASANGFPRPPAGQRVFELTYRPKEQQ